MALEKDINPALQRPLIKGPLKPPVKTVAPSSFVQAPTSSNEKTLRSILFKFLNRFLIPAGDSGNEDESPEAAWNFGRICGRCASIS
ncbi:hypothetical protein MKZ38_008390 [Zalerion maritima]|uniref:Uncharacterized protein n=1 Tax=Zalerion maritima TaxID=339359 RepID=A0AAD5RI01_9PEZI|nr:hypothetical protein MKZ38_008390 [Zalerion maritima]